MAFLLWYSGLAAIGPARAGLFAGLLPVAALGASVALGFEALDARSLVGTLVVGAGLVLGLATTSRRPDVPAPARRVEGSAPAPSAGLAPQRLP